MRVLREKEPKKYFEDNNRICIKKMCVYIYIYIYIITRICIENVKLYV